MDENEIRQLVEKVKQGDSESFETLYMLSGRSVYFICVSFLGNEEDAKDIMQEVYITAYEKLYQLNDAGKFVPWINQIAVNKCKKVLMKKSLDFMDVEDMDSHLTEENENFLPEEYITQKEKRKLVMDIMRNSLSDIQYRTVILYYFNGLTIDEIADIMECPPGTVKYRLSVSRAKIRDGVLAYENRSGDKLYSAVGLPLLMRLLYEEANSMTIPDLLPRIVDAIMSHFAAAGMSVGAADGAAGMAVSGGAADGVAGMPVSGGAVDGAVGNAVQNVVGNTVGNAAGSTAGGIITKGIGTLKAKIAIGAAVAAIVGVGAFVIINNKSDGDSDHDAIFDTMEQGLSHEMTDTEEMWEDTEEQETGKTTTEEPEVTQGLELIRLQAYSENRDGEDVISGHIKDISYGQNEMYNHLTVLGDDGHVYSYYYDGTLGYKIYDFGKPGWDISDIDIINSNIDGGSTGDFMLIEGNHYYYVSMINDEIIGTVDGTMFDGREIRKIGRTATYPGGFNVYCEDGSWYSIAVADLDEKPSDNFTYVDSERFLMDFTFGKILVPDGMELQDTVKDYLLLSDGKLYMEDYTDTPIEGTEDYTFTKLYDIHTSYNAMLAITDTNEMLVIHAIGGKLIDDLKTIKLPDAEILDLWYAKGILLIKTADGYYSCDSYEDTNFKPDEIFNSLTKDVVEISGRYVLLSDGYVYEFPSY